jgi:hypothetical protein
MNLSLKNENYTYSSLTLSYESRKYLSQEYCTANLADYKIKKFHIPMQYPQINMDNFFVLADALAALFLRFC